MSDTNTSLRNAVESAAKDQNITEEQDHKVESNGNETAKKDEKTETEEQPNSEVEESIDPEIEEAVNFYRALKDPNQQLNIISELARRAGVLKANESITQKEGASAKNFNDLLGEILGDEYPDLKDKLGKVFQAYDKEHDQKLNSVRAEIEYERAQKAASDFEVEFSSFIKTNNITEADAAKMIKEIEALPPAVGKNGKRISLTDYLGKIHRLVNMDKQNTNKEVERAKKIQQNLKERSTNLSSDISEDRIKTGSKLPSIRESIRAASEGVKFADD